MLEQTRRFALLGLIMAALVAVTSMFSSRLLYETSLQEQKHRLNELVQSQASLAAELARLGVQLKLTPSDLSHRDVVLEHLVRAQRRLQLESSTGEFSVGKRVGSTVRFLIVNGELVPSFSPLASISLDTPNAIPMKEAVAGESGAMVGLDHDGKEVLAAFTPLNLGYEVLGMVAKIDIEEIRAPFIRANLAIFGTGLVFLLIGLTLFYKVSEPILRELRQSEKKYRDLVEGANNIIIRIDTKGVISFANQYAHDFLVGSGASLIGLDAMLVLAGDSKSYPLHGGIDAIHKFFGEGDGPFEHPLSLKDGRSEWVSWTMRKLTQDDGTISELLCIGNVITAKRLAWEAQKEMEERFRGIAKASPVGIVITDMEGNLLYANERMHEMLGMNPVELAGQGWLSYIHPEDKNNIELNWFADSEVYSSHLEFRVTNDQTEIWVLGQIVNLNNSAGDVVGFVITFTDVTQIKLAESEQKRLTTAIDQAAEAIVITDLKGNITYVNPSFETITGYHRDEVLGKNPSILKSGEHDGEFYKNLWGTITKGEVWAGRFVNLRKNGQRYTQEATIGPVRDEQGKAISYVCVARDISEQLIFEAQLRQAQKLESIGELAAGIAHEINTPTQYVISNSQFLEEAFGTLMKMLNGSRSLIKAVQEGKDHDELVRMADTILDEKELGFLEEDLPSAFKESEHGLKRISEIVQSIKQLAYPGEVRKGLHSLNEIVRNAITVSTNEWKYVADIDQNLSEDLPEIYCLKGEVGQVVLNLIVNGAHAIESRIAGSTEYKGKLTLSTSYNDDQVILTVADNGSGMSDVVVERAFDPFFTTKEVGKGTGQGLAIAHNVVVNMHCGEISIETEEGVGSTFIIKLPIQDECKMVTH